MSRQRTKPTIDVERFWNNVDQSDDCWPWKLKAIRGSLGYGSVRLNNPRRVESSHRIAWMLARGNIPEGQQVLHNCDNPLCCRPDHLRLGTQADNIADMVKRNRARNGNIKLNPTLWAEIRASQEPSPILAARYGVHAAHIRKIKRGKSGRVYRP